MLYYLKVKFLVFLNILLRSDVARFVLSEAEFVFGIIRHMTQHVVLWAVYVYLVRSEGQGDYRGLRPE